MLRQGILISEKKFPNTVKLGYNDHGYNEYTVITNKIHWSVWFSMFYQ
jgi:hypothetical protein